MMEYPLLADGVDPDDLYPLDVDRALAKWDTIRDDTMFAPNVGALQQAVASDQVDMFFLVESRQLALLDGGTNIKPVGDKTVAAMNALAVPLGSTKKEAAEDFLQFLVQPEPSATMAELGGVSPINLNSKPNLSANGQLVDIFGAGNTGEVVNQDVDWYAENYNTVQPVLTNWLNG
jgi:putative spermidine/putrescine transport system substrate-binding protein